jgi:death-on-curing protein
LSLNLNGWNLAADDAQCVLTMLDLAAGDLDEDEFAHWLREHLQARQQ